MHLISGAAEEKATMKGLQEVRHCPQCGAALICVPVLSCAPCGEERPLRCYTYSPRPGQQCAECIDLDLLSQGSTREQAIGKLQEAMFSYLEAAFDGESTKGLVLRPSPLSHRIRYHYHNLLCWIQGRLQRQHGKHLLPKIADTGKQRLSH